MSYAFLIVVSVAITLKLMFLTFSLYFTMNHIEPLEKKAKDTKPKKSMMISWKKIPMMFLPKALSCPDTNVNKNYVINK